jgi:hypothetical protein
METLVHSAEEHGGGRRNLDAPEMRGLGLYRRWAPAGRRGRGAAWTVPREVPVEEVREEVRERLEVVALRLTCWRFAERIIYGLW